MRKTKYKLQIYLTNTRKVHVTYKINAYNSNNKMRNTKYKLQSNHILCTLSHGISTNY